MHRLLLPLAAFLFACDKEPAPAPTPDAPAAPVAPAAPAQTAGTTGKVIETMNAGGYTYVHVDAGEKKLWAAAPEFAVAVGDEVVVPDAMPMQNFHSNTLNRDFEVIYFANAIGKPGQAGAAATPAGHPPIDGAAAAPPASGGEAPIVATGEAGEKTVEQVITGKADLSGKTVSVKGKVVKFNGGILGRNWVHVQDGTGGEGTNDLTFTTGDTVAVGDEVVAKGIVSVNKDFGAGYTYSVIVEQAVVSKR